MIKINIKKFDFVLCIIFISYLTLLFNIEKCYSQENKDKFYWLNFGIGSVPNTFEIGRGLAGGLIPCYQIGSNLFSFRYLGAVELYMEGPIPNEYIKEISLLYGKSIMKTKDYFCSASIGVGIIMGVKRGRFLGEPHVESYNYERLTFKKISIPLEIQLFITSPYTGMGFYLFANVNREISYSGFLFCFLVGKL